MEMVKSKTGSVLTKREEELWTAIKTHDTVAFAARTIGLKPKTAYNMMYRLRRKYLKARRFVNFIEGNKRGNPLIKMVMTSRMEMAKDEQATREESSEIDDY